jgi:TonB family protein
MLFPGITIQGGEWKADSHPAEPTPASPRREESHSSSYALTIASSGNSGGGLRDFGVFGSVSVFTDYFDVSGPGAPPAPPWVLQYALATPCCGPQDSIVPPLPVNEVLPSWPQDLVASHSGETIVVYAVIDADGKLRDTRLIESPSSDLNNGLLAALAAWTFQPAEKNGKPWVVQALLGIPVAAYR